VATAAPLEAEAAAAATAAVTAAAATAAATAATATKAAQWLVNRGALTAAEIDFAPGGPGANAAAADFATSAQQQ
jgi:hypothetical protein